MTLNPTLATITTVGNGTISAANLLATNINRTGPTGNFSDTLDTAANIINALAQPNSLPSFECLLVNGTSYTQTLLAGTGITLAGASAVIPANSLTNLLVAVTSPTAVTVTVLFRATTA